MRSNQRWLCSVLASAVCLAAASFWFSDRNSQQYIFGYGPGQSIYPILDSEIENLLPDHAGWSEEQAQEINRALTLLKKVDGTNELLKLIPSSGLHPESAAPLARYDSHSEVGAFVDAQAGKIYLRPRLLKEPIILCSALLHELKHFSKDIPFLIRARGANDTSTEKGYEGLCEELRETQEIEIPCYEIQIVLDRKIRSYIESLPGVTPELRRDWLLALDFCLRNWQMAKVRHEIRRDAFNLHLKCYRIVPKAGAIPGTADALLANASILIYRNATTKDGTFNVGELQQAWLMAKAYASQVPEIQVPGHPNRITEAECIDAEKRLYELVSVDSARVAAVKLAKNAKYSKLTGQFQ